MRKHSVEFGILSLEETLVVCNLMLSGGCITFPTGARALHWAFWGRGGEESEGGWVRAHWRGWLSALVRVRGAESCVPFLPPRRAIDHQA